MAYIKTISNFISDCKENLLSHEIEKAIKIKQGRNTNLNEKRSWENSLYRVMLALEDSNINKDAEIIIEHQLPINRKRVDAMISGVDSKGKRMLDVIELKQWSDVKLQDGLLWPSFTPYSVSHPLNQVDDYVNIIDNDDKLDVIGYAYLHNFGIDNKDNILQNEDIFELNKEYDILKFSDFNELKERFSKFEGPDPELSDMLENISPDSIKLKEIIANKSYDKVRLSVKQKLILNKLSNVMKSDEKIHIVNGGPGSGKTLISTNLHANLKAKGLEGKIFFPSEVRENMFPQQMLKSKEVMGCSWQHSIKKLKLDYLIIEEAHKANWEMNDARSMIENFSTITKKLILIMDDNQVIDKRGIMSQDIEQMFEYDFKVYDDLDDSFRYHGDSSFLPFLHSTLFNEDNGQVMHISKRFKMRVLDEKEFVDLYKKKYNKTQTRLLSLFVDEFFPGNIIWNKDLSLNETIKCGGESFNWFPSKKYSKIFKKDEMTEEQWDKFKLYKREGAFINYRLGESHVGYITNVHGSDIEDTFIIVPDAFYLDHENDQVRVNLDKCKNSVLKNKFSGIKDPNRVERLMINRLYVLMTRATKSCNIVFKDKALQEWFKAKVKT